MFRLFLSVDMVGSTAFKASAPLRGEDGWLTIFRTFFTHFPLMLAGQIGFEFLDREETPAVDVWKAMGDEVIFTAQPSSAEEAVAILRVLLRTMRLYQAEHFDALPLRLKGTAWLADFSDYNIALEIPELSSSDAAPHLDFIGPDLDLGFRLSKYARPDSLILSLDLLEMLLQARNMGDLILFLAGQERLKGVMFDRPYPIVWMNDAEDTADRLPSASARPASADMLREQIDSMRRHLREAHGFDRPPVRFS
ncbi:hypothetical protein [Sphingopyxis flava]|uniref:Uncharacterized protein n=1 Tax=Sphingopyxis flava TaxID=1507287 RepID=A0A1T5BHK7_9SPHN|nr:hypothetical protein [Sphingopyxis flava]SKB46726.1 hypothetical protein SAMN06295937_1006190 [Sphingopyxis flava]